MVKISRYDPTSAMVMAGDVSASSIKSLAAVGGLSPETQKGIDS
jgi:hypothetical protein